MRKMSENTPFFDILRQKDQESIKSLLGRQKKQQKSNKKAIKSLLGRQKKHEN